MKKVLVILQVLLISGCAVTPKKFYDGPERQSGEVSSYSLWNYADFFSGPQIYTVSVDSIVTEKIGGFVSVLPGSHTVKVSFKDVTTPLFPGLMQGYTFQGWYEIKFISKPGKSYAPIFNQNLPEKERIGEMCIAEFDEPSSIAKSREKQDYLACGTATIPPTPENIKLCQGPMIASGIPGRIYEENCFKFKK